MKAYIRGTLAKSIFAMAMLVSMPATSLWAQTPTDQQKAQQTQPKAQPSVPQATVEKSEVPKKQEAQPSAKAPPGEPVPPEQPYPPKTEKQKTQ